jgi:hypothetical protein
MSQRSRRFMASREASRLPEALDRHADDPTTVVPSMRTMSEGKSGAASDAGDDETHAEAARQVEAHGPGFLETARQQINSLTGKLVEWGKEHPARMAGAAAALIAVSGLLVGVMKRRSRRIAKVGQAARQVKARLKSGVHNAVKAVGSAVRTQRRGSLVKARAGRTAMAGAGRSGR